MKNPTLIASQFKLAGPVGKVEPLGNGLINDTFKVSLADDLPTQYVLQHINNKVFPDVDMLQNNIETVTNHIRKKLMAKGVGDIDRRVLRFVHTLDDKPYLRDGDDYWRVMVFVQDSVTYQAVTPENAHRAGLAFGDFQYMLSGLKGNVGKIIPNFHNIEFRLKQLEGAVAEDKAGRCKLAGDLLQNIWQRADRMCLAEQLHRAGKLPKRICHCNTKVNNMLFDKNDNVLCIIDLDTVMPNFIFSDYGDFLRSAANTGLEDDPDLNNVEFDMAIFNAFTDGYLESTRPFLLPVERDNLPYAALLFPYMQAVRFLTDYLNGDTYYKIQYPEHNWVRTLAQWKLFTSAERLEKEMQKVIMKMS